MPTYTLDLIVNPADLQILKAAQLKITIAKPVGTAQPNVTWLAIDPFQGNKIEWDEEYSLYASPQQQLVNGAVISRLSETSFPATDAAYYSFTSNAVFSGPFTGPGSPPRGTYQANNDMPITQYPSLTFGLQQKAAIRGNQIAPSPINAAIVPAGFPVQFTPLTTVYIWLQASFTSGTVITQITGRSTQVTFGGTVQSQTLIYDPASGRFVPAAPQGGALVALAAMEETPHVQFLMPAGVH